MRNVRKLRTFAGRLRRDIGRKAAGDEGLEVAFADILAIADRVIAQRADSKIGHLKSDGLLERNHLKGTDGDAINAILCAIGHNMRLLAAWLKALWRALFRFMENQPQLSRAAA